jgi:hypothetical protein
MTPEKVLRFLEDRVNSPAVLDASDKIGEGVKQ